MAITTLAGFLAASRQQVQLNKATLSTQAVASSWSSSWTASGTPGAGSNAVGNTANGTVPTSATTGAPLIRPFSGTGYITSIEYACNTQPARIMLFDCLFRAGSYAINTATTLTSVPSYSARVPGGDYSGLQLYAEGSTNGNGSRQVTVTYTDQSGGTGHSTPATTLSRLGNVSNGLNQIPLASGDCGIQAVESITFANVGTGTTNIMVVRPLWIGMATDVNSPRLMQLDGTSMPVIYSDSCLMVAFTGTTTTTTTPGFEMNIEIASA